MLEFLRDAYHLLTDVQGLIQWGGTLMVCTIVFVETGLFVGFFLPGDSLLVSAGIFAAMGHLSLPWLLVAASACAVAGDQVGYWIGRRAGQALYRREDSFFFRKQHLQRAHDFYEKYGGKTIVLARFVPIVRTFAPAVAGAANMNYRRFVTYQCGGRNSLGVEHAADRVFSFLGDPRRRQAHRTGDRHRCVPVHSPRRD